MGIERSAADAVLDHVFGDEFAQLTIDQASLVITDFLTIEDVQRDMHAAALEYKRNLCPPDKCPGYMRRYAIGLQAQRDRQGVKR